LPKVRLQRAAGDDGRCVLVATIKEVLGHVQEVGEHCAVNDV
jgi:hypothetical protein